MKAFLIGLLVATASVWAEPVKWSISVGSSGGAAGGRTSIIESSGDILVETWVAPGKPPRREVTGYVNREELDILERMLADPQLHKAQVSTPANLTRFLKFNYGDVQRNYSVKSGNAFPEPVERLSKEVTRALSAAKQ